MGRTTIDGLAVRSSSDRQPVRAPKNSRGTIDMTTSRSRRRNNYHPNKSVVPRSAQVAPSPMRQASKNKPRRVARDNNFRTTSRYNAYKTRALQQQQNPSRSPEVDIEELIRSEVAVDDFLNPVESFGFDDEVEDYSRANESDSFVQNNNDDWSNLLGEMNRESNAPTLALGSGLDDEEEVDDDWVHDWSSANVLTNEDELEDEEYDNEEEFEEEPSPRRQKKRRRKRFSIGKILALTVFLLLIAGGGVVYFWGDSLISRLTGGNSGFWDTLSAMISDTIPFETDADGRTNVLIFGTGGYNMDGDLGESTQHDGAQLTDSIMVVSFNQETKDVALLSLPRDLKVPMACLAGKINEVYSCYNKDGADEQAGAEALMKQVGSILDIDFQYYAHVNWASLTSIIDTIGGITVTLDEDINDYGWTNAVAQAGVPIQVDGEQALGLARARHGTVGGDFTRGNTQQKIVQGIVEKIISNGIGVNEALGLLNILGDNLRSNFSADNIKAAVGMMSGFDVSSIRQVSLVDYDNDIYYVNSATINEISYVVPTAGTSNYKVIQEYIRSMFSNNPLEREGATVVVYNATDGFGVASSERDKLTAAGFNVVSVGDADASTCQKQYCVYALNTEMPSTQAALTERYGNVLSAENLPAELQDGVDFVIIIGDTGIETNSV